MKNLPKINPAKAVKASLPYLIAGLLCTKLGEAYRLTTSGDVLDKLLAAFTKLGLVFQNPFPSLHPFDLLVGAAAAVLLRLVVWSKIKNAKKYRHGEEYGTARWGNEKDIAPFINSDFSQNILLTDTERLTLGKIADPEKRNVNLNVLVIGGSGSGKTRYHIKPNLLQMNASYVCSDPKGTVVEEVGRALVQQGHYKLKILNTIDFGCSMHYNPFHYLHSETDILSLVTVIMENTQSKEGKGGDDFWSKAEALLYQALIAYIYYEAPEEEKNMTTLLDMLNACECREDDENFKSAVDLLSYGTLQKLDGKDWRSENLLSLAGVYKPRAKIEESSLPAALVRYLAEHPHIRHVVLRLDNDATGRIAAETIKALLPRKYAVTVDIQPPPQGKDYNDCLCMRLGLPITKRGERSKER